MKVKKCKICKTHFYVEFVDFKDREYIKKTDIEIIQLFCRWLRANEWIIKRNRKLSLCFNCYIEKMNECDTKYLDGSYIK